MKYANRSGYVSIYLWVVACILLALAHHYLARSPLAPATVSVIITFATATLLVVALGLRLGIATAAVILFAGYFTANYTFILEPPTNLVTYTSIPTSSGKLRVGNASVVTIRADVGDLIRVTRSNTNINTSLPLKDTFRRQGFAPVVSVSGEVSGEVSGVSVPVVSHLLRKRYDTANKLYYNSGGKIYTTQSHLFGYRTFIPEDLKDMYIITGLSHLLAQSGLHVGIMVALFFMARRLTNWRLLEVVALVLIPMIIPLSAFSVTVMRATLFALSYMACRLVGYRVAMVPFTLLWGGVFILWDSSSIFDISFQMSFLAVLGIALFVQRRKPLGKNTDHDRTDDDPVGKSPVGKSPVAYVLASIRTGGSGSRTQGWVYSSYLMILIGVAATIFTTPIQLYNFGTTNYASIFTTLALTPVVSIQILLGVILLLTPSPLTLPIILPALYFMEQVNALLLETIYHLTYPLFIVSYLPLSITLAIYIVSVAVFFTPYGAASVATLLAPMLWGQYTTLLPNLAGSHSNAPRMEFYNIGSSKGFAGITPSGERYVYFSGTISSFRYRFLPKVAQLHTKTFDYGNINIYGESNYYLRINNPFPDDFPICVNANLTTLQTEGQPCVVNFVTRSNTLTAENTLPSITYIIYNNTKIGCNIVPYKGIPSETPVVLPYQGDTPAPPPCP